MSGSLPINALAMPIMARSDRAGPASSGPITQQGEWSFGNYNRIPNYNPPGTYTGAIPTPPTDAAQRQFPYPTGQRTEDYYHMLQLLQQQPGQPSPQLNQLLQMLYMRGRT